MIAYIIVFVISSFLLWTVENKPKKLKIYKICVFTALLFPICLAAFRKIGVGTDTAQYVWLLYDAAAHAKDFVSYFNSDVYLIYKYVPVRDWELGYITMVYIAAKVFNSFQGVLFATHSLIIFFIYKGLERFKGKIQIWFAMLSFYLMFYNHSLNIMRQWIAMSILFYGFTFLIENKKLKYFFAVFAAFLFHTSAIIGIIVFLVYQFVDIDSERGVKFKIDSKLKDISVYKNLFILCAGLIVIIGFDLIRNVIAILGSGMARYVKVYLTGEIVFMPNQIIRRLPVILLLIINWRKLRKESKLAPFYCSMCIIDCLISQLNSIFSQSSRISYYFSEYNMLLFSVLVQVQTKISNKKIVKGILFIYLIVYWYYEFLYSGWGETIPYKFFF